MRNRNVLFLALGVALLGVVSLSWWRSDVTAEGKGISSGCVEGTWVGKLPDGRLFRETLVAGRDGSLHFALNSIFQGDNTLGGLFPDATYEGTGPFRGSAVRTGPNTFDWSGISYAVNVVDGVPTDVAYIEVDDGTVHFPDCDTQETDFTALFFLPEQDANGDGVPDEGEEPFLVVPDLQGTITKFYP